MRGADQHLFESGAAYDEPYTIDVLAPAYEGQGISGTSPYRLSREEVLKGLANRFVHSTTYLYLYATMAGLSLLTVVMSLLWTCPGPSFYLLELLVNVALVAEVGVRLVAFGKNFWKSTFNVVDLGLVLLCLVTLIILFVGHGCSPLSERPGMGEELLDSVLLIVRNVVQCMRLLSVIRRSRLNVTSRITSIDLNDAQGFNLDLDLEEESSRAHQRMQDGLGDHAGEFGWNPSQPSLGTAGRGPQESILTMHGPEDDL